MEKNDASLKGANVYDAVILAAGDYPTAPQALSVLENASFVCCCDSAAQEYIERSGRIPDAIVGDGDSLPPHFKRTYKSVYHEVAEQDYNDLTKATRFVLRCFPNASIAYLGTTGKREDHTLGNIFLMAFFMRNLGIVPTFITNFGTFHAAQGSQTFTVMPGQQVSIFNLSCHSLSSHGLKWEVYPFTELWQGTLNEATASTFSLEADGDYLVYIAHSFCSEA